MRKSPAGTCHVMMSGFGDGAYTRFAGFLLDSYKRYEKE